MFVQDDPQSKVIYQKASDNIPRFRQGEASIQLKTSSGAPLEGVEIEITQQSQDFLFGNLVFDLVWGEPYLPDLFKKRFLELFNFAILPFYWSFYERVPGRPEWQRLLPTLEWCLANGITAKGHPLVWPYDAGVPEWLYDMPEGSVETLIKSRVTSVVKGFEDYIQTWDVTNEAVNHISWEEATSQAFRSKYHDVSLWRGIEVAGSFKREIPVPQAADWVEKSFRWAYAANPKATLIVNDYNQEIDPNIRQRFYDLVKELQRRGTPVSGIGLQVHPVDYWISPQEIWDTLEMYADLNVPVHITELHQPALGQVIEGGYRQGSWTQTAQAEYMEQLYRLFYGHPTVVSINHWGYSDRNIWIQGAGLIDEEYRPKPVFNTLKKLIKGEWITPTLNTRTDANGKVTWGGFFGKYQAVIRRPGMQHISLPIHMMKQVENSFVFILDHL